jgi:hypothetical protein
MSGRTGATVTAPIVEQSAAAKGEKNDKWFRKS